VSAPASHGVWSSEGPFGELARKRLAFVGLVPLPLAAICFALGQGVLGVVLFALGLWPLPFRCTVGTQGIRIRWLAVSQLIPWADVAAVKMELDGRRWVLGARARVLAIRRHTRPTVTLRARSDVLAALMREISRLAPAGAQALI
jgi:hypothetical protein